MFASPASELLDLLALDFRCRPDRLRAAEQIVIGAEPLDDAVFPAVTLARAAGERGGTAPAVYNAANEVAVDAFHEGRLRFPEIVATVSQVLDLHDVPSREHFTVDDVLAADAWARAEAAALI